MISFHTVRRGEWLIKVSVHKHNSVLVAAYNPYDMNFIIRQFLDHNKAADFIEKLIEE